MFRVPKSSVTDDKLIEQIKEENDRLIMKIFGLDYDELLSQATQDEN